VDVNKRFWSKVDKSGDCWLWTAYRDKDGYGNISIGKPMLAHRAAWELVNSPIPDGMCVLHKCDVPSCVNPAHLFLGTKGDNNTDRSGKGHNGDLRGEKNGMAKLTNEIVCHIRAHVAQGNSQRSACEKFGLSKGHVSEIVNRKYWTHAA